MKSYILFQLGDTDYAIPIEYIKQLDVIEKITPVPNTPHYVEGIVFTRGQVITAINLRKKFSLEPKPLDIKSRLIHLYHENRNIGLIVDSAREFVNIDESQITAPQGNIDSVLLNELEGIVKLNNKIVLILNAVKLLETISTLGNPNMPEQEEKIQNSKQ